MSFRRLRLLLLLASVFTAAAVGAGAPAFGHAALESTDPQNGAIVDSSPKSISLHFGEDVDLPPGAIEVYDAKGSRVETGDATQPGRDKTTIEAASAGLKDGTYLVSWKAISADTHPVHGAFSFQIGRDGPNTDVEKLGQQVMSSGASGVGLVKHIFGVDRFLLYSSLVIVVGAVFALYWWWPELWKLRRVRRIAWVGVGVGIITTSFGIGLQGLASEQLSIDSIFHWKVIDDVLSTRYGEMALFRLASFVVAGASLALQPRFERWSLRRRIPMAGTVALLLCAPFSLSGHASTGSGSGEALVFDMVHLASVSIWLGGLAFIVCALFRRSAMISESSARGAVGVFSGIALGAVGALVATGILRAWREVGSWSQLWSSHYGKLLIIKVVFLAIGLTAAWFSRSWVRKKTAGKLWSLRRFVLAETIFAALALIMASTLVASAPAKSSEPVPQFAAELTSKDLLLDVTIDPPKVGSTSLHFYTLTSSGTFADPAELKVTMRRTGDSDIGPLTIPVVKIDKGHWVAEGFVIPVSGRWTLDAGARVSDVDELDFSTEVPIK